MSKDHPLVGCLAVFHDRVDCEDAGIKLDERCASCWIQSVPYWSEDQAKERVIRDMVFDDPDAGPRDGQILAGLDFLREMWKERRQTS